MGSVVSSHVAQSCEAPYFPHFHSCVADMGLSPISLAATASSVADLQPELPTQPPLHVDVVADPPSDVLMQRPDDVSPGLVWPYPDVFHTACDILGFSTTSAMFGSRADPMVPRYYPTTTMIRVRRARTCFQLLGRRNRPRISAHPGTKLSQCWRKSRTKA